MNFYHQTHSVAWNKTILFFRCDTEFDISFWIGMSQCTCIDETWSYFVTSFFREIKGSDHVLKNIQAWKKVIVIFLATIQKFIKCFYVHTQMISKINFKRKFATWNVSLCTTIFVVAQQFNFFITVAFKSGKLPWLMEFSSNRPPPLYFSFFNLSRKSHKKTSRLCEFFVVSCFKLHSKFSVCVTQLLMKTTSSCW